ncbi:MULTISPECIES: hypothetical protein [Streptomycetaceae]|uniref:hypothetical protein n=1 Tax=Streptomycetaceae TaxID=2062 RepID=UPI00300AA8A0
MTDQQWAEFLACEADHQEDMRDAAHREFLIETGQFAEEDQEEDRAEPAPLRINPDPWPGGAPF